MNTSHFRITHLAGFLVAATAGLVLSVTAAAQQEQQTEGIAPAAPSPVSGVQTTDEILPMSLDLLTPDPAGNADRKAYFGDLHVHTKYSFDAYAFGTLATPDDAYRYAKGKAIKHPGGFEVRLREPLDFYAVTDHAMFLGVVEAAADTRTAFSRTEIARPLHNLNAPENLNVGSIAQRSAAFRTFLPAAITAITDGSLDYGMTEAVTREAWADTVAAADRHYRPGEFTTFAAYEYTSSTDDSGNLHRNVIFRATDKLPAVPFSRFHSRNPESLWQWMDDLRDQGVESLAIPHNSNGSNGQMFKLVDWAGNPMDGAYADLRMRNEPLVEITQVKGTSDTHPSLSSRDEWADFEIMPFRVATSLLSEPQGSYVREAYRNGLALERQGKGNPYKFGLVGASDTHTGAISADESDFFAKIGLLDSTPQLRGSVPLPETEQDFASARSATYTDDTGRRYATGAVETWSASGLAAVWADDNTRDSIYAAFRRKETFATSGPRIRVRFFAGYDYDETLQQASNAVEQAYTGGVSMGNNLLADGEREPAFLAWATGDPDSARLQRLQVIKGFVKEDGSTDERVYDVACSDGLKVDPTTQRCPDNGARVDISNCATTQGVGATELKTLWRDPEFDASQDAFYYVRALENPTCRWSTWDAVRAGVAPRPDLKKTLQERAWSSPIWYVAQ
ncbi:MAG: DUF3604 domain-containing protein [Halioglobus sp.]|nr:DUF3604 domain-containing protein [Halioglobus sp.]